MKINVQVSNEVVQGNGWHTFNCGDYNVKPVRIIRYSCGRHGAARSRFYYHCQFIGFGDMLNCHAKSAVGEVMTEVIIRKQNPKFNPKKLNWVGDVADIEE